MHKLLSTIFPETTVDVASTQSPGAFVPYRVEGYGTLKKYPLHDRFKIMPNFKHPVFEDVKQRAEEAISETVKGDFFPAHFVIKDTQAFKAHGGGKNEKEYFLAFDYKRKTFSLEYSYTFLYYIAKNHYDTNESIEIYYSEIFNYQWEKQETLARFQNLEESTLQRAFFKKHYSNIIIQSFGSFDAFFNPQEFQGNLILLKMLIS